MASEEIATEIPSTGPELTAPPVLSTPAEHILEYTPPTPAHSIRNQILTDKDVERIYEISRTAREIHSGGYKRIALQFPDGLLSHSSRVYECLAKELQASKESSENESDGRTVASLYVLADTSYSPCCVDLIAASHVEADCIVHYGQACLTPLAEESKVHAMYVLTNQDLDVMYSADQIKSLLADKALKVVLMADGPYQWALKDVHSKLQDEGYTSIYSTEVIHDVMALLPNRNILDLPESEQDLSGYILFHIGESPQSLLLLLHSRVDTIHLVLPPTTSSSSDPSTTSRYLRRRYAALLGAASASVIGVLIASPSAPMLSTLSALTGIIQARKKKPYIFAMGKLNAAKLANFAEIGAWVVLGCWMSSLVDGKVLGADKPIVTPWELGVALDGEARIWGNRWEADVKGLQAKKAEYEASAAAADDDDESAPPEFDFRTGRYKSSLQDVPSLNSKSESTELAIREHGLDVAKRDPLSVARVNNGPSAGAEFLNTNRTWTGLGSDHLRKRSQKVEIGYEEEDEEVGAEIEQGRSGIARGYTVGESDKR
jgi:diphthamide biosynthesis protein 2